MYDELTSTLCNKETITQQAQKVVWLRGIFFDTLDKFFKAHDQEQCDHAKLYLRHFVVSDQFQFESIESLLAASPLGIWNNYPHVPDTDVYSLDVYKTILEGCLHFSKKFVHSRLQPMRSARCSSSALHRKCKSLKLTPIRTSPQKKPKA